MLLPGRQALADTRPAGCRSASWREALPSRLPEALTGARWKVACYPVPTADRTSHGRDAGGQDAGVSERQRTPWNEVEPPKDAPVRPKALAADHWLRATVGGTRVKGSPGRVCGLCDAALRAGGEGTRHSHHLQPGRPGVAAALRDDLAGVVSDVARPRLADEQGPVRLHHDPGAAGRGEDHVVLPPHVAAAKHRAGVRAGREGRPGPAVCEKPRWGLWVHRPLHCSSEG